MEGETGTSVCSKIGLKITEKNNNTTKYTDGDDVRYRGFSNTEAIMIRDMKPAKT